MRESLNKTETKRRPGAIAFHVYVVAVSECIDAHFWGLVELHLASFVIV